MLGAFWFMGRGHTSADFWMMLTSWMRFGSPVIYSTEELFWPQSAASAGLRSVVLRCSISNLSLVYSSRVALGLRKIPSTATFCFCGGFRTSWPVWHHITISVFEALNLICWALRSRSNVACSRCWSSALPYSGSSLTPVYGLPNGGPRW